MSEDKPKLKVLDLFSGILVGGFSLGLERTGGFETVAFCEIEPFPRKVLAKHWPKVPQYEDVRTLTAERLAADGIAVDVITGGFPCQDISVAGKQAGIGEGTRSGLWSECLRLVSEIRPEYAIFENVSNLLSGPTGNPGAWFSRVLSDLASVGYDAEWENIPASAVGAPHRRERVWIVAYSDKKRGPLPFFDRFNALQGSGVEPKKRRQNRICFEVGAASSAVFGRWLDKPKPDGMADGVSDWPHRLAACGNAVVPQIPELIGRAILEERT